MQSSMLKMVDIRIGVCSKLSHQRFFLVHTMKELKMTGNCLKGTRPLLSFDSSFDAKPHWSLLKELMTQVQSI